ncbi:MAG: hypothetical protein SFV15_16185 [Polyangiaceae bacterium]|nr:hypothetical protein [Polyangiaceae bacterium]
MHTKFGWILAATLPLTACGEEGFPSQIHVQKTFQSDPFPNDEAASNRAGGFIAISSSGDHSCGIRQDASLWCWGANSYGQVGAGFVTAAVDRPTRVSGEAGWERVSAGARHTCGIRLGALFCWGNNEDGELGDGTRGAHSAPALVDRGGWLDVAAGASRSCALNAQGKLYCWGDVYGAKIPGEGVTIASPSVLVPILVEPARAFRQVVFATQSVCALEQAGKVWCSNDLVSLPPTEADWVALSVDGGFPCARKADGSRWCHSQRTPREWKSEAPVSYEHFCGVALDGSLWCSGKNPFGQLGNALRREETSVLVQVGSAMDWVAVATGRSHTCAINEAGEAWCWGRDHLAQLGAGRERVRSTPQLVVGPARDSVVLGAKSTCGIEQGKILCWGSDLPGGFPVETEALGEQIGSTSDVTCTLSKGMVTCVGSPDGLQRTWDAGVFRQLAVNNFARCAIAEDNALYCERSTETTQPQKVGTDLWQSVSVGTNHMCGISPTHKLFCWGNEGALGVAAQGFQSTPQAVTPERDYLEVTAGNNSTCAIALDQSLWCWGSGYYGALGTGTRDPEQLPVRIGTELWSQVSASLHTCAIRTDGALFCWGLNASSQLGVQVLEGSNVPVQVGTSTDWKHVEAGPTHTCALNQSRQLYCWGNDSDGQIGAQKAWNSEPTRVWPR